MTGIRILFVSAVATMLLAIPSPAAAYVGPGVALAAIGAALAFLAAIAMAVGGFVWYPVKRLFRFIRGGGRSDVD